ncbi:MAG: YgiT-type zinc finger protein [Acidobacteriaceae bacterium]
MDPEPKKPEDKSSNEAPQEYARICPECHTGVFRLEYLTYFTWLNDELITVPNFPSWVCDVCGKREYDVHAVNWLNMLLSPTTGRKPRTRRRNQPGSLDRPQAQS